MVEIVIRPVNPGKNAAHAEIRTIEKAVFPALYKERSWDPEKITGGLDSLNNFAV